MPSIPFTFSRVMGTGFAQPNKPYRNPCSSSQFRGKPIKEFVKTAQVKMSILDNKGAEFFQQILPTSPCYFWGINLGLVKSIFLKKKWSKCQQSDGSLTFSCQIVTHIQKRNSQQRFEKRPSSLNWILNLPPHYTWEKDNKSPHQAFSITIYVIFQWDFCFLAATADYSFL